MKAGFLGCWQEAIRPASWWVRKLKGLRAALAGVFNLAARLELVVARLNQRPLAQGA